MEELWKWASEVFKAHGAIAAVLFFLCFIFWKLTWRVWDATMKSKDAEIERLVKERDTCQNLVFERLLSSEPPKPPKPKEEEGKAK